MAACLALVCAATLKAHDIPNDVAAQILMKPEGSRLRVLVRVPLGAMRDMDYPKRQGGVSQDLLDLGRAEPTLRDAATLWVADFLDFYEQDRKLPAPTIVSVRAALQSDRSFASYEEALAHLQGPPLDPASEFFWSQGLLDIFFEYPIDADRSLFSIDPRLGRLGIRTVTVLHFMPPDREMRTFEFQGDPGLVRLDPSLVQAVRQFVGFGFRHIGDLDHVLFLLCLAIPLRRAAPLVTIVTAFAVAHTISMFAAAFGVAPDALWFPPMVETLIAASIVYLALENVVVTTKMEPQRPQSTQRQDFSAVSAVSAVPSVRVVKRRWAIAFAFGLLHGFGFSFGLQQTLQFAGSHVPSAILAYNAGIEAAQLTGVAVMVLIVEAVFRRVVAERIGTIIVSAIVAHTAWHWMAERWDVLRKFRVQWPAFDALFWVGAMRWMMLVVVAVGLYWLVFGVMRDRSLKSEV